MKHELTPEVISQIVDFAKKYEPKGDLVGIPREVISKMLQRQYEQQGEWYVRCFEKDRTHDDELGGIDWEDTIEKWSFWSKTLIDKNFSDFFTRYHERFESEPQYRDSLGYPLEIGEGMYYDDYSVIDAIIHDCTEPFNGMVNDEYKGKNYAWSYAVSVKAYKNNPSEVMERIKQLEQKNKPEPVKQEEKPSKPVYVTPCGTFTEGEVVKTHQGNRIFYKYDENLNSPYVCVLEMYITEYKIGAKIDVFSTGEIFKLTPLPTIEEVANKAGISVEQLREVVKQGK